MSLVNDALRKARYPATPPDRGALAAARQGLLTPTEPQRRSSPLALAITFTATIAVVAIVGALWVMAGHKAVPSQASASVAQVPMHVEAVDPNITPWSTTQSIRDLLTETQVSYHTADVKSIRSPPLPIIVEGPPDHLIGGQYPDQRPGPATRSVAKGTQSGSRIDTTVQTATTRPASLEPQLATTQSTSADRPSSTEHGASLVRGSTYLRRVTVPGISEIQLEAIVWSADNPMALINGDAVGPGTVIGNVRIEAIEPRRVLLRHKDITFFVLPP